MRNKIDDAVDIKEVRSFLRNHPDFFDNNSDILETMVIHHKTDGAVSIVERHLQKLQEKNKLLNEKLNHLIENADQNQNIFESVMTFSLKMLNAHDLKSFLDVLSNSFKNDFKLEFYSLILFNESRSVDHPIVASTSRIEFEEKIPRLMSFNEPIGGQFSSEDFHALFNHSDQINNSVAICKIGQEIPLGFLAIGSSDHSLYHESDSRYFLSHLSNLISQSLVKFNKNVF